MGHLERKIREKENIRKSILKAALDIATAEGWQAVTIRKIAESIDYTTSIVYAHFDSKEALFQELTIQGFSQLYHSFEKILSEESDPKKQLIKLSLENWDFAQQNRQLYQLMFSFERPKNEHAIKGMSIIKGVFSNLTGKKDTEVDALVLNWICLRQGAISVMFDFDDNELPVNPRDLYIEFINRFIFSIS